MSKSKATATMSGNSHLRFFRPFSGSPILIVHYPWQVHANPSVEVQWLADGEPEPPSRRPLVFVDGYLKGDLAVDAERCRAGAERVATSTSRSKAGIEFDIHAKRNSLTVPAVWVDCHLPLPGDKTETRTAFCMLQNWAVDGRTLYLDLPSDSFAKPGKLRFWMLRGQDTVWMETVAWPGMPGGADDKMSASTGAGAKKPGAQDGGNGKPAPGGKPAASGKAAPGAKPAKGVKKGNDGAADDDPFAMPKATRKK